MPKIFIFLDLVITCLLPFLIDLVPDYVLTDKSNPLHIQNWKKNKTEILPSLKLIKTFTAQRRLLP